VRFSGCSLAACHAADKHQTRHPTHHPDRARSVTHNPLLADSHLALARLRLVRAHRLAVLTDPQWQWPFLLAARDRDYTQLRCAA
jgi:hypothetical protein